MKKIINTLAVWLLSFAVAFAGALIAALIGMVGSSSKAFTVILNAVFFLLMFAGGYAGMTLAFKLLKIEIYNSPKRIVALVLCAVLIAGAGAGGQVLFMLTKTDYTVSGEVDVVLLLDSSYSMTLYEDARTDAACDFVESLDETTYLQVVTYGSTVIDRYTGELLEMNDTNKVSAQSLISSIDSTGGTDYSSALSEAIDTLTGSSAREDSVKAAILLTDGDAGDIDSSVVSDFESSGITLFTIRIADSEDASSYISALTDLAASSGGADEVLVRASDGSIDASAMLAAFENAFEAASYSEISFDGNIMLLSYNLSIFRVLVMLITFAACSLLFGIGYYAKADAASLAVNLICAAAAVVLSVIFGGMLLRCIIMAAFIGAAFVLLELEEKKTDEPPSEFRNGPPGASGGGSVPPESGEGVLYV